MLATLGLTAALAAGTALDPEVRFVTSWAPYRLVVSERCAGDGCTVQAELEAFEPQSPGTRRCAAAPEGFPPLLPIESRWIQGSEGPQLHLRFRTPEGDISRPVIFRPAPDCSGELVVPDEGSGA